MCARICVRGLNRAGSGGWFGSPGDAVRALDGRPSTVVSATPDPGLLAVHNLTVEFALAYFIDAEVREGCDLGS